MGIRAKLFAAPAEQLTLDDLDRFCIFLQCHARPDLCAYTSLAFTVPIPCQAEHHEQLLMLLQQRVFPYDTCICRYDVIVALGSDIKQDMLKLVQPEWHGYYDAKVCILDQFSHYLGEEILRTGGSAILETELSSIIRPILQESRAIPDLLRPSLDKGKPPN